MNCIQELEAQNLQDSWSVLYFGLAEYLLNQSEQGEELVRSAVRTYGELVGNREREQQRKKGIKTNLQNFYIWPQVRFEDPRLLEKQQRLNEQVALTDVIRCPFASSARRYGTEKVAKLKNLQRLASEHIQKILHRSIFQKYSQKMKIIVAE